jgi:UDP-N-acetylmuramyl pentapeptide phosphotransferase/UDP-N-acetylglucosamine-1-phosphate transferase
MGDVGSAFLGYTFAALAVLAAARHPHFGVAGALLVWPFVFDTVFTFVRRARKRERLHEAHRSHLYQRLNQTGVSHARVSLLFGALAALGVVAAMAVVANLAPYAALAIIVIAIVILVVAVQRRERRRDATSATSA